MLSKSNKAKDASVIPSDHAGVGATIFPDRFYAREWKHPPLERTRLGHVEKEDLDRTAGTTGQHRAWILKMMKALDSPGVGPPTDLDPEEKHLWRQHQSEIKAMVDRLTGTPAGRKVAEKHMWSLFEDVYLLHKVGLPTHEYAQPDEGLVPFSMRMAGVIIAMKQYPRVMLDVVTGRNTEPFAHNPGAAWRGGRDDMLQHIKNNKLQKRRHAESSKAAVGQEQSETMQSESGDHDMDSQEVRASLGGQAPMRQEEPQTGEDVVETPFVHTPTGMEN
ncbi:hypothetical protein LTS10_001594 [Elasticomyces elasticus]|nr:hypothetical protein LTS10_001594 [Elasticomyces elasticus]